MAYKWVSWLQSRCRLGKSDRLRYVSRIFVFSVFITFLASLFHFREVKVNHLDLNTIADQYELAQVGFEFPDVEATRLLKEESLRDVGRIYCLNDEEIVRVEKKVERHLVKNPQWREVLPGTTFEELMVANETMRDLLKAIDLTDARTASRIKNLGGVFYNYPMAVYVPETLSLQLPMDVLRQMGPSTSPALDYIRQLYHDYSWNLVEDLSLQNEVRQVIKDAIPLKMTRVEAGSRIINAGEKVTMRHLDMMKAMKKAISDQSFKTTPLSLFGSVVFATILTMMGLAYFRSVYPNLVRSCLKMSLIGVITLLTLFMAKLTEFLLINSSLADYCRHPIFVLFATLTLSILIGKSIAMLISGFVVTVLAISLSMEYSHFLVVNLSAAVISLYLTKAVRKRKDIFTACGKAWLFTLPLLASINFIEHSSWDHLLADCATTFVSLSITGILVVAILPLLETTFGVVTDMTLLEMGDPTHPLLRRLSLEAPGTYQHSLGVAALAEECALTINANGIFCRIAALYHDIGKLAQPHYYTENQFSGFNMHQLLTPLESAQLIISHVQEGVLLAKQHEIPESIIDVIRQHHGTGLVYYFFHAHIGKCHLSPDEVDEASFRYPGPIPQTRESAIVMIADSVEAAFRSLDETTEKAVIELVEVIVGEKIRHHQLDASHLTLQEIETIKKVLVRSLVATSHGRVKYPQTQDEPVDAEELLAIR